MTIEEAISLYPEVEQFSKTGIVSLESPFRAYARAMFHGASSDAILMSLAATEVYRVLAHGFMYRRGPIVGDQKT